MSVAIVTAYGVVAIVGVGGGIFAYTDAKQYGDEDEARYYARCTLAALVWPIIAIGMFTHLVKDALTTN